MPLETDSRLPAIVFRLGTCDESEVPVTFNLDTCAGMNVGNLLVHQYLITKFPDCVHSYEEYNDENPFNPIALEGVTADTSDKEEFENGKLTAVVRYHTRYELDGQRQLISFGLGSDIAVNGLIGLPTLREWKVVLDIHDGKAYSKNMTLQWPMEFTDAACGLPPQVKFAASDFVRPLQSTSEGKALAAIVKVPLPPLLETPVPLPSEATVSSN